MPAVTETENKKEKVQHKISLAKKIAYLINPLIYIVFSFLYFFYYLWLF